MRFLIVTMSRQQGQTHANTENALETSELGEGSVRFARYSGATTGYPSVLTTDIELYVAQLQLVSGQGDSLTYAMLFGPGLHRSAS
jgi:hypothetical protein